MHLIDLGAAGVEVSARVAAVILRDEPLVRLSVDRVPLSAHGLP